MQVRGCRVGRLLRVAGMNFCVAHQTTEDQSVLQSPGHSSVNHVIHAWS